MEMTRKVALSYAIAHCSENADVVAVLSKMMESLDKRSTAPRKPTKTQLENETIKEALFSFVTGHDGSALLTATEIANAHGLSVQKASALLTSLYNDGRISKVVDKGRSYFFSKGDEVGE